MVSIIAMGNTLQSFRDHTFLYEKLYTGKPDLVNGLQARTFGIWTLLSSVIRCLCAIDIHNKMGLTWTNVEQLQAVTASGLDNVVTRAGHWRGLELSSQQQSSPQSRWKVCSGPQALPHHALDLPPRPGALPLRVVCIWDRSSHHWRPGTPHGGKFLNPGNAGGAPVPRSRTRIQTEEEKLRPTSPRPRPRLPPLLASSFTLFALKFLFCSILHF
ncbi:ergosterol biosynthetic protein 28 homolog isoform X1 [Balaenoptera musculus]|uniref:Ergosterol biosynthetic protein 28 homolog isoform X1 n=1 Tax=Balaenoptera musculus TaxID=9771 RepID=A0A8B8WPH1_BALMU|nr:ergosterol biosynthetic protein 28 homolog isoform X1 [Balaenoptera musculus]XP_036699116.1 ergosterol biosynthetic protein 28 homolog isoform X1 [Balaenoptera musculus]